MNSDYKMYSTQSELFNLLYFRKLGREFGSILFCTTGILLQHIQRDSALNYYSHIIIDEIHERDTISDFTLTILKSIIPVVIIYT